MITNIKQVLTDDLLHPKYRGRPGAHCYVASEAYYHLSLGHLSGLKSYSLRIDNDTVHWWLEDSKGNIIDLTADQFDFEIDYSKGVRRPFLTQTPSKRARIVMDRVLERI